MKIDGKKANREQLYKAMLSLNTLEECVEFLCDLCTDRELEAFEQRLGAAKRILDGDTYEMIEAETNARSSMVSRVKKCLDKENSGFRMILERMEEKEYTQ
ncbi:TrpR-related protein YerC/YecD [Bacillus pakistanensis]|uniref:TrpR-related protein YerC/YecD n=1 Tax=Rossellomorea pakistanensis TaxID=992288 RepID=A0ABS2NI35_9BACI|nr:YerC/YecD family TrpR-related protein [Bacillus pakistanensis]MBM7587483.1 TrpR-related protein YerC/YecD [Bacillus pakistanensis]